MEDSDRGKLAVLVVLVVLVLLLAGASWLGLRVLDRLDGIEGRIADLSSQTIEAKDEARLARERAERAEQAARDAAAGRQRAEANSVRQAESAAASRADADAARAEADRVRAQAEAELNRLQDALGAIAETRRTALGLVMNLGEDSLKFDFDKAEIRPESKELLSRVVGILLTSSDYTVQVNGHTDDVGSAEYNQGLSERRAAAVRDYFVQAGIPEDIIEMEGRGKSEPLVEGTSDSARARNRRVELEIVNTRIRYPTR